MIVVADTNIMVRTIVTTDNPQQSKAAFALLKKADKVIVPLVALCETVWVLRSVYKRNRNAIALSIRAIVQTPKIITEHDAVAAGLRMLDDGGDFADGVIQHTGARLAGAPCTYASFDRTAIKRFAARGIAALLPE